MRTLSVSSRKRRFSSWVPKSASAPRSGRLDALHVGHWVGRQLESQLSIVISGIDDDAQLADLVVADGRGRAAHEVGRAGRLGEGDHVADGRLPGQDHHDAVEAQGDAAVGRRPVLEGLQEEPEALLRLLVGHATGPGRSAPAARSRGCGGCRRRPRSRSARCRRPWPGPAAGSVSSSGDVLVARRGERMVQAHVARCAGVVVRSAGSRSPTGSGTRSRPPASARGPSPGAGCPWPWPAAWARRRRRARCRPSPRRPSRSSCRATASLAPFFTRLATASSVALSVNSGRSRAARVGHDAAQPQLLVDLPQPRAGDAARGRAARSPARARLPRSAPGSVSRPSVAISSVTSAMGISKRRSGLSLP